MQPKNKLAKPRKSIKEIIKQKIRNRAIGQAKAKIALLKHNENDYTEEQLETIVAEEEQKIRSGLIKSAFFSVLILIGLNLR